MHENVSKMRIESERLTDVFDRADKGNRVNGALRATEKHHRESKKRQGTTLVVPQVPRNELGFSP